MAKAITWVGIDDDKKHLTLAVLTGEGPGDVEVRRVPNEDAALRRWVRRIVRAAGGGEIRMCYEAGPNGFALMRRLEAMGPVVVEVIAPSLTPRRSGRRVKTDPIDATQLARLYRAGELRAIAVPDEHAEAARDLVRLHYRVGEELMRKRHHILKFLVNRGRIYRNGSHWTDRHRTWLKAQRFEAWTDTMTFEELLAGMRELESRRTRLRAALERLATEERYADAVGVLRCFHAIDTVMATTLVTEIFDVERFAHPRSLTNYLGQTASVHQSAEREIRGAITKAGNRYARWALGQIATHYRTRPSPGPTVTKRREGQPAWAIEIAERAHHRLHRRYWALVKRGLPPPKAKGAVARELTTFIWEALIAVRRHTRAAA